MTDPKEETKEAEETEETKEENIPPWQTYPWGTDFVNATDGFYKLGLSCGGIIPTTMFVASIRLLMENGKNKEGLVSLLDDLVNIFTKE